MSVNLVNESAVSCKQNAQRLRDLARSASDADVQKMLLVAAHHLDVAVAELDYILTGATVAT